MPYERTVLDVPDSYQLIGCEPLEISVGSRPFGAFCQIIAGLRAISAMPTLLNGSRPNLLFPRLYPRRSSLSLMYDASKIHSS